MWSHIQLKHMFSLHCLQVQFFFCRQCFINIILIKLGVRISYSGTGNPTPKPDGGAARPRLSPNLFWVQDGVCFWKLREKIQQGSKLLNTKSSAPPVVFFRLCSVYQVPSPQQFFFFLGSFGFII